MSKLEVKMHSVIVLVDQSQGVDVALRKAIEKTDKSLRIKNITFEDLENKKDFSDEHFLLMKVSEKDLSMFDSEFLEQVKDNQFNLNFVHSKTDRLFGKKNKMSNFEKVISKDSNDFDIFIEDYEMWNSYHHKGDENIVLIGDIHENMDAIKNLMKEIDFNSKIVILGDYLDKGNKTEEVILYMEELMKNGVQMIAANHEAYVARRLTGEIKGMEAEDEIFSSLKVLRKNEFLAQKVINMYEKSLPFFSFERGGNKFYATHAPCEEKYLGKLSSNAVKAQRNFYFKERNPESMARDLRFLNERENKYYHVFGHVAHEMETLEMNKRIWLDTGAVYGNKLSAVSISPTGEKNFIQVKTEKLDETNLFSFQKKSRKFGIS